MIKKSIAATVMAATMGLSLNAFAGAPDNATAEHDKNKRLTVTVEGKEFVSIALYQEGINSYNTVYDGVVEGSDSLFTLDIARNGAGTWNVFLDLYEMKQPSGEDCTGADCIQSEKKFVAKINRTIFSGGVNQASTIGPVVISYE